MQLAPRDALLLADCLQVRHLGSQALQLRLLLMALAAVQGRKAAQGWGDTQQAGERGEATVEAMMPQ